MPQLHAPDSIAVSPDGTRVTCTCQWSTPALPSAHAAMLHLEERHPLSTPRCVLCERERPTLPGMRFHGLRVLTDRSSGDQFLVCADDETTCRRLAQQMVKRIETAAQTVLPRERGRRGHLHLVR